MPEQTNYNQPEPMTKVISGTAKVEKKKLGKRMVDFLFSDKIDSVANYLAYYILGPSIKDLIFKMGTGALQMALFGGNISGQTPPMTFSNGYQPGRRDPYMYNQMANPGYAQPQMGPYQQRLNLNDVSFDTKDDAWLVLDRMNREIARYQKVRAADFYTFSGITGQQDNWALQGYGWYNLNEAHPIMRTDGRWIIDFPPVQSLR